ncbi:hypothetical protein LXL04_022673 [Taraxacum kok-saghyz]
MVDLRNASQRRKKPGESTGEIKEKQQPRSPIGSGEDGECYGTKEKRNGEVKQKPALNGVSGERPAATPRWKFTVGEARGVADCSGEVWQCPEAASFQAFFQLYSTKRESRIKYMVTGIHLDLSNTFHSTLTIFTSDLHSALYLQSSIKFQSLIFRNMRRYNKKDSTNRRGSSSSSQQNEDNPPQQEGYRPTFDHVLQQQQQMFQAWLQTQTQYQYQAPKYPTPQYPSPGLPSTNFTYHSTIESLSLANYPKSEK